MANRGISVLVERHPRSSASVSALIDLLNAVGFDGFHVIFIIDFLPSGRATLLPFAFSSLFITLSFLQLIFSSQTTRLNNRLTFEESGDFVTSDWCFSLPFGGMRKDDGTDGKRWGNCCRLL